MSKRKEAGLESGGEREGGKEEASLREGTYKQVDGGDRTRVAQA